MYKTREISNSDDIVDSRDVIKRIDELEDAKSDFQVENELPDSDLSNMPDEQADKWLEWDESEEGEELTALKALQDECEGYTSDWRHGESLIRDSYFAEYARQFAEDIGAISGDEQWPLNCIDWDKAVDELQMDYTSVDWDGETYWIRS